MQSTAQIVVHLEKVYKKDLTKHKDLIKKLITRIVHALRFDDALGRWVTQTPEASDDECDA